MTKIVIALILFVLVGIVACTPATPETTATASGAPPTMAPTEAMIKEGMVFIPAGSFEMGMNPEDGLKTCRQLYEPFSNNECGIGAFSPVGPVHNVYLDDYYIDVYEVTNAQYEECVAEGICNSPAKLSSDPEEQYFGNEVFDNYPVINVTWEDADTFCKWRGARLPTEAEWEKAARGPEGFVYPWGNEFDGTRLNFCDQNCSIEHANTQFDDGYAETAPVGSYPGGASPYGILDLGGNVWEWVADWFGYEYYGSLPAEADNPKGPAQGELKVLRGGSWDGAGYTSNASYRGWRAPSEVSPDFGFRCAKSP